MNTVATLILVVLLIVMFTNFVNGTLGQWFRAKFFNDPGA